jgi:hypothetical protein
MKIAFLFTLLIFGNSFAAIDYINKYFPENSIIRKVHNSEPSGTGWLGFDSNVRAACDNLNKIFSSLAHRAHNDYSPWYLYTYDDLIEDIKVIVGNQDEKAIQIELEWAWELKNHLDKKVIENYEKTPEYKQEVEHELEREQRIIAIRKALEQKEQGV